MNKKALFILWICAAALAALLLALHFMKPAAPAVSPAPAASESVSPAVSPAAQVSPAVSPGAGAAVSASELKSFEKLLNEGGNYGFLLSQYDDVRDADLTQVFYVGAGITPPSDEQAIVDAYSAARGGDVPQIDCTVLKSSQIDGFLQEKTGYTLKEMRSSLKWEYEKASDAYLFFHGDTNQVPISVASGKALGGDKYALTCTFGNAVYDSAGNPAEGCVVTFSLKNGKPVFLSNALTA